MISKQTTDTVIMVAPTEFESNPEACSDNHFADSDAFFDMAAILAEALQLKNVLLAAGVQVIEIDPSQITPAPNAPDGCFPNNWLMFEDGRPILCPMRAVSRRKERAMWPAIAFRLQGEGFQIGEALDLSSWEQEGRFLEGTGSLVLDRNNRIAYAARSERTSYAAAEEAAKTLGYELIAFDAADPLGRSIYHTNVIMSIGSRFAVVCTDAIPLNSRKAILDSLVSNKILIEISWEQVVNYCGNVLELATDSGNAIVAMSKTAYEAFSPNQINGIRQCGAEPVYADISTIEGVAGGSVRCMLAEVFANRFVSE